MRPKTIIYNNNNDAVCRFYYKIYNKNFLTFLWICKKSRQKVLLVYYSNIPIQSLNQLNIFIREKYTKTMNILTVNFNVDSV